MNQNDLYIEYARVIEMCNGTALEDKPWLCVKFNGTCIFDTHPRFGSDPELYKFAVVILEDRAVFVGDILYLKSSGLEYVADKYTTASAAGDMTWQPPKPKRTFILNGVESPCPVSERTIHPVCFGSTLFFFDSKNDVDQVEECIENILIGARDKP